MKEVPLNQSVKLITPRVTALITTVDKGGNVNAAPYSWVAPVSFSPPLVYVGIGGKHKHTYINAKDTGEFVVNIVSEDFGQQAVNCEEQHSPGTNLMEKHGLGAEPSKKVGVPRVRESRSVMECKVKEMVEVDGSDHVLLIGEIVHAESEGGIDDVKPLMHDGGRKFRSVGKETELERGNN